MANYYGYIPIAHDTYENFKSATQGNIYYLDSTKPYCWNFITELWYNVGFPQGYPLMSVSDYPAEIWIIYKEANASYNGTTYFDLVYTKEQIKKGDVIVVSGLNNYSDIAIANEDYNSSHPYYISVLIAGYQGVTRVSVVNNFSIQYFLGAFRYVEWNSTPPTPPTPSLKRSHFNWVLFNKRRNML